MKQKGRLSFGAVKVGEFLPHAWPSPNKQIGRTEKEREEMREKRETMRSRQREREGGVG
jgi:hypothetical protein